MQTSLSKNGSLVRRAAPAPPPLPVKKRPTSSFSASNAAPTWLTPKSEAASSNASSREEDEQQHDQTQLQCVPNDEFDSFLSGIVYFDLGDAERTALSYLRSGPPYKGRHMKGYKGSLKEQGAKWLKNPDCPDSSGEFAGSSRGAPSFRRRVPFGWYVAPSLDVLRRLLLLPRTSDGRRAWWPIGNGLDEEAAQAAERAGEAHDGGAGIFATRLVLELVEDFDSKQRDAKERERERALEAKRAHEQASNASKSAAKSGNSDKSGKTTLASDDTPDEIERLVKILKRPYDASLIAKSATCDRLGPRMSTNARRVLRALHLKILTPHHVRSGNFEGNDVRITNGRRMKREAARRKKLLEGGKPRAAKKRKRKPEPVDPIDPVDPVEHDTFSHSFTPAPVLLDDETLEYETEHSKTVNDEEVEARFRNDNPLLFSDAIEALWEEKKMLRVMAPVTTCRECEEEVVEQFGCVCVARDWSRCASCMGWTTALQPCTCLCTDVDFPVEVAEGREEEEEVAEGRKEENEEEEEEKKGKVWSKMGHGSKSSSSSSSSLLVDAARQLVTH